jgi:hypothetical protein
MKKGFPRIPIRSLQGLLSQFGGEPSMDGPANNRNRVISGVGAAMLAILEVAAVKGYDWLLPRIGHPALLGLYCTLGLFCLICLVMAIGREKVLARLRTVGNFFCGIIRRLVGLDELFKDLESRLVVMSEKIEKIEKKVGSRLEATPEKIEKRKEVESRFEAMWKEINTILAFLPVSLTWVLGLHGNEEVRKQTLRQVRKAINDIRTRRVPTIEMPDGELAQVIGVTGTKELFNTTDVDEWDLISEIRQATYRLSDEDYGATKNAMKLSAQERLGKSDESVEEAMVRAYAELTKNANQWELGQLSQNCFEQLQYIRASRQFVDSLENRRVTLGASYGSASFISDPGHRRVWKRVWPNNGKGWGNLRCWRNGGVCPDGQLVEVSLCGAYCRNCRLDPGEQIDGLELDFPYLRRPVKVLSARLIAHDGQFAADGARLHDGFGIEFLNMREADFDSLARYVSAKKELDGAKPPPNAPWL